MNKKWTVVSIAVLLLMIGVGWLAGFLSEDPKIAELERLRDERMRHAQNMSDDQRRAHRDQFREKLQELSEDQRHRFFENNRGQFQQFAMQRMEEFFAKSPEEQRESLDKMIDRMEEHRQQREAGGNGRKMGGNPNSTRTPQMRDQRRKQRLDRTTPEMRSMRDAFRELINKRRQERGLEPIHGRPGWGRLFSADAKVAVRRNTDRIA